MTQVQGSFVAGLLSHVQAFARTVPDRDAMFVEVTLVNGHTFFCRGLVILHAEQSPDCVMIHGAPPHADSAQIARDAQVFSAEFVTKPPSNDDSRRPFGFTACGAQRQ